MSKAYAGLKVLDFTTTISGPHCTRLLADLGAEVIKVEAPEGDMMRMRPPQRNGASTAFGQLNAGKKSVALDLKDPRAIAALRRLVADVDVLVENFRPGVMARLGLDYASLAPLNPRLVYCSISGYGQTGPSSQLPAYAPVIHAASGYDRAHLSYQMGRERPDYCGIFVADVGAGAYAFGAIGAALHQRAQTGKGQHVDVSMMETMLGMTLNEVQAAQFQVPPPGRPLFGPMRTAEGYVMVAIASERTFQGFLAAMGRPDLEQDPRFARYVDRRLNWGELMDIAEAWSEQLGSDACLAALDANGVPCSHYRTVAEAMADPQIAHRRALAEIHDAGGTFKVVNPPFRMSGGSTDASGNVSAKLGEHTREVLRAAGLDDAEIAALGQE
ncbi:MAG TPA: CoA transferase [Quisquiliibacterium sp.]|nr:CoA transferase [Quisquiliibacterium sp.]HQD83341.1 CoA transferase [Quisquiliibacterium sp.]HQN12671.1 CoA transferase [Quisquiliibacterium sp.]HQP66154.1 CoA transferase [Quisquiliibacterium sp.]